MTRQITKKIKNHPLFLSNKERDDLRKVPIIAAKVREIWEKHKNTMHPIWPITVDYYGRDFDHNDKQGTWLFYQKINGCLKKLQLGTVAVNMKTTTSLVVQEFLSNHTEEELADLIKPQKPQ